MRHKTDGKGLLKISLEEQENTIECIVEDNGIGRENSAKLYNSRKRETSPLGIKVSNERIEALNDLHKGSAAVEISDRKEGSGTIVKLRLPKFGETM